MLSCRQVTDRSSALLDDELGIGERLAVRMHLLMCVHCRRFNRQLRNLVEALGRHPDPEPVDRVFVDRVMDQLDSASRELAGPDGPQSET